MIRRRYCTDTGLVRNVEEDEEDDEEEEERPLETVGNIFAWRCWEISVNALTRALWFVRADSNGR